MTLTPKTYLTSTQKAAYLANVLSISKSQDQMNDVEAQVLQGIINSLDATWDDIQKANRMLANPSFALRHMKSPELRRDNVEDMITMALADGDLTAIETAPIEKLTDTLGYSQADMDMLVKRAETELSKLRRQPPPPPPEQKDVPHELVPEPPVEREPEPAPPPPAAAPKPPPPAQSAPRPKPVEAPKPKPPAPKPAPSAPKAHQLTVDECRKCREQAQNSSEYCFGLGSGRINIWGCRLMNMNWAADTDWLLDGVFRDDDTFVFDRSAISRRIEKAVDNVKACPYIKVDLIETAFDSLPQRASIWGRWQYRECKRNQKGAVQVNAVEYLHGQRLSANKTVCGLSPDGIDEALKIIRRALKKTSSESLDTNLLRKDCQ